ncbi:MFS transporter [Geodermatophilus sp. YIM 151500]|uniref:MFS transporter n=1 Tax=Geodermatophilus sp. YIM 151500 TaxID=2984531 RepID=UPI0021E3E867|nr:MFS transporter [Geodermatophilus sp. YIM 151500]MCV2490090.1 MFS transporter [Geodermatophilus sp. YIM 151500]
MSPRTVFAPYVRLFAVPGARSFAPSAAVARLPIATLGLGAVLLLAAETGSYGLAGTIAGTIALFGSLAGPAWARAMDRRGQGRVLRLATVGFLASGTAFLAAVLAGAPLWSWFALAALTGSCEPNIGSLVRARWAFALAHDERQRLTAFAFESVVDEVVFVIGPPLVTLLAALIAPPAGFLTGLLLGVSGALWLSTLRASEPPVHPPESDGRGRRAAALDPAVLVVGVAYLAVGTVFGAMDVVVVGFADEQDVPVMAGVALAAYASGSLVAGLAYGVARLPGTLAARFLGCALFFGGAAQGLLFVASVPGLIAAAFVAGLAIAPVLVAGMSLVETRVPRSAVNEGLAWTSTGLTLGVTAGAAVAGVAVDAWGAEGAFAVPAGAAALAALLAVVGTPALRLRPRVGSARS